MTKQAEQNDQSSEAEAMSGLPSLGEGFNLQSRNLPSATKSQPSKKATRNDVKPEVAKNPIRRPHLEKNKIERAPVSFRASVARMEDFYAVVADLNMPVSHAIEEAVEMWTVSKTARLDYMKQNEAEMLERELEGLRNRTS